MNVKPLPIRLYPNVDLFSFPSLCQIQLILTQIKDSNYKCLIGHNYESGQLHWYFNLQACSIKVLPTETLFYLQFQKSLSVCESRPSKHMLQTGIYI